MEIPLSSTPALSGVPTSDSKLSETGFVPLSSRAPTGLIHGSGKGRPSTSNENWYDFVDRDHTHHSELTRSQVEYTCIFMRHRSIQSNLPFYIPTDKETDQEFTSSKPAQTTALGDVPGPTTISDDPPPKFTNEETPKPPSNEEHPDDIMFYEDSTSVGAILILTIFKSLQNPSSSKPTYDFNLFSSKEEEVEEIKVDATNPGNHGNETETNPAEHPSPSEPQDVNDGDDNYNKSESSTSEPGLRMKTSQIRLPF